MKPDAKPVPLLTTEKTTTRTHDGAPRAARPAIQPISRPHCAAVQGKGSHEDEDQSETQQINGFGHKTTEKRTVGETTKQVKVSVIVPSRYFEQVCARATERRKQSPPQANDLDAIRSQLTTRIKNIVAPLLPTVEGLSDPKELVAVNELPSITPPPIPEPEMKAQVMGWLRNTWTRWGWWSRESAF